MECQVKMKDGEIIMLIKFYVFILIGITTEIFAQGAPQKLSSDQGVKLQKSVASGIITYKLTVPQEVKRILGAPQREIRRRDGGMDVLEFHYPDVQFTFGKFRSEPNAVFTLLQVMLDYR